MDAITIELMEKEATANVRRGKVTEITNAHTHTRPHHEKNAWLIHVDDSILPLPSPFLPPPPPTLRSNVKLLHQFRCGTEDGANEEA